MKKINDKSWVAEFLEQIGIITKQEFDSISSFCEFSIDMPNKKHENVLLSINANQQIPLNLYHKLSVNSEELVIEIKVDLQKVDIEIIKKYISYFLSNLRKNNVLLNQLLSENNFYVNENNLLIKYFSEVEKQEINLYKTELLNFFKKHGVKVNDVILEFDKAKQEKSNQERVSFKKHIEDIKTSINASFDPFKRLESSAKIKGQFSDLNTLTKEAAESGEKVNIKAEIFSLEKKTLKNNLIKYSFSLYDYKNGGITIDFLLGKSNSFFDSKQNTKSFYALIHNDLITAEQYLDSFKEGQWIEANIKLACNKYTNFKVSGTINTISHSEKPKFLLASDKEINKRVELLVHSNMTSFDGICSVLEIYDYAKQLNHTSLGIIERGNVQSIPAIVQNSKATNIKPLYGCEFEVINKIIPIVVNPINKKLNEVDYVIFDIETTGLNNEFDELIEFGAIKYHKGLVSDRLDFFVKPSKQLSSKTTSLTHITDDMVKNGVTPLQAIKKIKEFISDSVLIAHNGINFDLRFLNKICEKFDQPLIKNCLIDTMVLSRAINVELTKHTLEENCKKYKIEYDTEVAHRADKDAEYLFNVWQNHQVHLTSMGINSINQINQKLQNDALRTHEHGFYVDVYAKDQQGIKILYELVSLSLTKQLFTKDKIENAKNIKNPRPKLLFDDFEQYRSHILLCPHPFEGEIWDSVLNDTKEKLISKIKKYDYIFLAPVKNIEYDFVRERITKQNAIDAQKKIIDLCNQLDKKICAVSDAYYLYEWQKDVHEVYLYVKQLGNARHRLYSSKETIVEPDLHYLTTKQMLDEFSFIKDKKLLNEIVIENTINFAMNISSTIQPLKSKLYTPKIENVDEKLRQFVYDTCHKKYGENPNKYITDRIQKELDAIIGHGYAVIYWIAHLLVEQSNKDGYLVGSRGSVGSSLVAYLSNISEVNPLPAHYVCNECKHFEFYEDSTQDGFDIKPKICPKCGKPMFNDGHNIPFESFLGFKGDKVPDIDLNFSGENQASAHNFIRSIFGKDHSFRAGTIQTVKEKTAFGYVKNYFEEKNENLEVSDGVINFLARKCVGVKRTTGSHPGGIVIVPNEHNIYDFSPINYSANDTTSDWLTTHFDFHAIHDNILKFDILGHDEPTILRYLYQYTKVDPQTIPYFDEKVIELFASSKSLDIKDPSYDTKKLATIGLPEFGTQVTRRIVKTTKPKGIGDLIRISGLSHGTGVWQGNAEESITKLNHTLQEVACCREDIIFTLNSYGIDFATSFEITEKIRKGNGLSPTHEKILKDHKVPEWYMQSCKLIQYIFPKAHATAYVIDAIRTAWYKVHYPAEFYAVFFSVRTDKAFDLANIVKGKEAIKAKLKEISSTSNANLKAKDQELIPIYEVSLEMLARGIKMSNISIEKSDSIMFKVEGNTIIPPFSSIDGLGSEVAKSIIEARKIKPFTSLTDFKNRTKITSANIKIMKELHILENLEEGDQMTLFN